MYMYTHVYTYMSQSAVPPRPLPRGRRGRVPEISEYALQTSLSPLWFWVKSNDSLDFP